MHACGQAFTIGHALSCPTGGYPSIHHNELQDITADLLKEVCTDVTVEPFLQPLTGEVLDMRTIKHKWRGGQTGDWIYVQEASEEASVNRHFLT